MALDTSALRAPDDTFPPIKERGVTLIRIANGTVTQAVTVSGKWVMMQVLGQDDTLNAVWTGQWRSDAFSVPSELLARWKQEPLP